MSTTVTVTVDTSTTPPTIHCSPRTLTVSRKDDGTDVLLTFNLSAAGFSFPPQGAIVILSDAFPRTSAVRQTTPPPNTSSLANVATLRNVNERNGDYPYCVTVQANSASGEVYYSDDPIIRNGP
jgi:hypothetical protein